jgi:glycerophosphoryl diester phosphodiesterase
VPGRASATVVVPELVAHRGYALHYPENTIVGIEAAIRAGARYVEVDVQLSRDQVPVLFHDPDLRRVCNADGAVSEHNFEELRRLRASEYGRFGYRYAQVRIATLAELAELLERHPEVTAFVELKRESLARFGALTVLSRVRRELEAVRRRCVIISYDLEALTAARRDWALGAVIDRWRERRRTIMQVLRPEYLFCNVRGLPWFGRLRFGEARLAVFEVADPALALKLARRGVHLIETFAVGEMRAALELAAAAAHERGL